MFKTKKESSDTKNKLSTKQIVIIALIIFLIIVSSYTVLTFYFISNIEKSAQFGDTFGGLNAIFSGLAFGGVILTIYLQRNELALQRHELKLTRKEFATQNETLKSQRFENTFFKMVSLHHEIIDKLEIQEEALFSEEETKYEKRRVFKYCKSQLTRILFDRKSSEKINDDTTEIEIVTYIDHHIKSAYTVFFKSKTNHLLSHYFRNLYHIFKYIYNSELDKKSQRFYASLVRAQLSADELYMLFYNGLCSGYGYPNFLFYIKEYNLFDNFDYLGSTPTEHQVVYNHLIKHVELETNL